MKKLLTVISILTLSACGGGGSDSSESDSPEATPFLSKARDLSPANDSMILQIDQYELLARVKNYESVFQFNGQDDTDTNNSDDESQDCMSSISAPVKTAGEAFYVDSTVDTSACFVDLQQELASDGYDMKIELSEYRLFMMFSCAGQDFTQFEGQSIFATFEGSIGNLDLGEYCRDSALVKLHNNSQTRFRSVITGPEGVFEWHSTKNYAIDNQSQPCEFRVSGNIESMEDGCQWIELETLLRSRLNGEPLPDEGGVNYFSAIARGVSANRSLNNLWHETGYFDVIVNNWMGLVSFVDSVSDPYYVFESQGQVVEGAFPIFEDNASTPNTRDEAKNLFTAFPRRPLDLIKSYSGSLPK